ncbi:MAG: AsmA-like C-terminal region-containing protein, partial [Bacteroidota bacterium]|nr:AsmA-like C-terminal region-containing protein [Bacteroidota bacterium]
LSFEGKLSDIDNERYDQFKADGILDLQNFELTGADYPPTQISKMLLRFSPQYAALETFNARSGKSDFIMDGRIDNILNYVFEDELLTGRLNFKSALIDADELMASESSELPDDNGDSNEVPADEMSEGDEVIRIPENIKFVLNADIKKLIYDGMAIENIQGLISLDAGKASMKNLSMDMLGGTTKMSGSYNSKPEKPLADFNLDLSNVDIKALYENFMSIQEMAPIAKYCSGNISAKLSLNTALDNEMMPDYPTLNSAGNLSSRAIGITNNKLFEALGNKTKISMLSNPTLKDVNLSFEIKNGNLEVKPTEFNIKDIEMSLAGTQNINTAIDFDLGMNLPKKYASKFLSKIPLKNMPEHVELAVGIGGTNDKPKITSVNSNITGGIKEEITEKVEEVKEDLKEEAQKIINEAQKKADAIIAAAEQQAEALDANAKKAGDKLVSEAERQGQKLVDEARNPITKAAAKKAKAKMIKEAQKKSGQLQNEAKSKGDKIINTAENKADKIMEEARRKADSL